MTENKKSYYAVIPANVRYDESLSPNAKLLYGEITALCNAEGFCWASNNYFAELYEVTDRTIKRWLKDLTEGGYIKSKLFYKKGSVEVEKRLITISPLPHDKNVTTPMTKMSPPSGQKCPYPRDKNVPENNTDINTTFNNTKEYIYMSKKPKRKQFIPPTLEEVQAYCKERKNNVDAQAFFDYYSAADWYDKNGDKVRSWKQKVITWEGRKRGEPKSNKSEGYCMPDPNNIDNLDDLF